MALDRNFRLRTMRAPLSIDMGEVRRLASLAAGRHCVIVPPVTDVSASWLIPGSPLRGAPDVGFIVPPMQLARIEHAFATLADPAENPYELLEREGILVLAPVRVAPDRSIVLAGGSLSSVRLELAAGGPAVSKAIRRNRTQPDVDGIERHRGEAALLRRMTQDGDPLFPPLRSFAETSNEIRFETEFFAAYTLAELVFQGRLDGERLGRLVITVYERLRSTVYHRPAIGLDDAHAFDYARIVRRRMDTILGTSAGYGEAVRAIATADRVRVNGHDCLPYPALLAELRSRRWHDVLRPGGARRLCHGDLILEDILVRPGDDIRLIDPNPFNSHPLFDVAKTLLSLLVGYEFAYFDLFDLAIQRRDGTVDVEIQPRRADCWAEYLVAAKIFTDYLTSDLGHILGLHVDGPNELHRKLRMAAALHALAIPWFHLERRRPERAAAFAACGLFHASYALRAVCAPAGESDWLE